jgi:serine/threonine protein kinase
MTHLFSDAQVILSPRWLEDIIAIQSSSRHISLFRPCSADLILTKMMRVDPIDRADIEFLLKQDDLDFSELEQKLKSAVIPNIDEFKEAFKSNLLWLNQTIENLQQR